MMTTTLQPRARVRLLFHENAWAYVHTQVYKLTHTHVHESICSYVYRLVACTYTGSHVCRFICKHTQICVQTCVQFMIMCVTSRVCRFPFMHLCTGSHEYNLTNLHRLMCTVMCIGLHTYTKAGTYTHVCRHRHAHVHIGTHNTYMHILLRARILPFQRKVSAPPLKPIP